MLIIFYSTAYSDDMLDVILLRKLHFLGWSNFPVSVEYEEIILIVNNA